MLRSLFAITLGLAGWLASPVVAATEALAPRPCPAAVAEVAACFGGQDANGSWLLAAIPGTWNRALIVHAHGGPRMSPPAADDPDEDLERFAVMVRQGYAWIGPSYRRGDYGVRRAAADVENARALFVARFGAPRLTVLHGQSWGAQIALKTLELHGRDLEGRRLYDAALLTNGVVAGGARAYQFRADLRAIYQFYCANHPRPDEPSYPLWMGLPPGGAMAREDLDARIRACTGVGLKPQERSAEQAARLADILAASGTTEGALRQHMNWATRTLRTLIDSVGGANPFDNRATVFSGVHDPAALNAGIERFTPDPQALALLDYDSRPTGQVIAPVLSIHARRDPQVSPALQDDLGAAFAASGREALLSRIGLDWSEHSRLPDDVLVAALEALEAWAAGGPRPDPAVLRGRCNARSAACTTLTP
jgi:hypothetical protein